MHGKAFFFLASPNQGICLALKCEQKAKVLMYLEKVLNVRDSDQGKQPGRTDSRINYDNMNNRSFYRNCNIPKERFKNILLSLDKNRIF
jgi:hypothetical protein